MPSRFLLFCWGEVYVAAGEESEGEAEDSEARGAEWWNVAKPKWNVEVS